MKFNRVIDTVPISPARVIPAAYPQERQPVKLIELIVASVFSEKKSAPSSSMHEALDGAHRRIFIAVSERSPAPSVK
jgi:hypothetical protein